MAISESDSGWWSSLLTAAKDKSVTALSVTKRDLAEFVSVLSNDTTVAVKHASDNIKTLIQNDNSDDAPKHTKSSLSPPSTTSSSSVPPSHPVGVPYDRSQAQLFTLQSSPDTFLTDPLGVESEYETWAGQFEVSSRQSEISQLLVNCPHVRSLHSGLVPAKVSYNDFWKRYFFKLGLLQQEEQRRADLMARVQPQPDGLAWEELEEMEEEGEKERGSKGNKEEMEVEKVAEEMRSETNDEQKKDTPNREDDVASSIVEIKSDHFRSESSDSFVCVSEDLPHSDRSHASPDDGNGGGEWEYLKMVGEGGGGSGESSEGGDVTVTVTPVKCEEGERGEVKREGGEEKASESSDWESWDD